MIFVDTSFWVALVSRGDTRHPEAAALLRAHADDALVTSTLVRGETWTFLRRRHGHTAAVEFLDRVERSPRLRIVAPGEGVDGDALRYLRRHDERRYSYVDATSFVLMKGMRIRRALAFDADFTVAGFTELRA